MSRNKLQVLVLTTISKFMSTITIRPHGVPITDWKENRKLLNQLPNQIKEITDSKLQQSDH